MTILREIRQKVGFILGCVQCMRSFHLSSKMQYEQGKGRFASLTAISCQPMSGAGLRK
jgi:hypothetical protein